MDWNSVLMQQADQAKRAVHSVPRILSHPKLTLEQCTRLRAEIMETRFKLDMIHASLKAENAPPSFEVVATQLGQIWGELSDATARRLKTFDKSIAA